MTKLKWCIKRTPENYKKVNEWVYKHYELFDCISEHYVHSEIIGVNAFISCDIRPDFHEINLDEFSLLTDPEKYNAYSYPSFLRIDLPFPLYDIYSKKSVTGHHDNPIEPTVSEPVFNELQRMWKERESEKVGEIEIGKGFDFNSEIRVNGMDIPQSYKDQYLYEGDNKVKIDEDLQERLRKAQWEENAENEAIEITAAMMMQNPKFHIDDFKTEAEKEILKSLKKINRKLNRILKRQKEQF